MVVFVAKEETEGVSSHWVRRQTSYSIYMYAYLLFGYYAHLIYCNSLCGLSFILYLSQKFFYLGFDNHKFYHIRDQADEQ